MYLKGDVICDSAKGCSHSDDCGGAVPHQSCYCEKCPINLAAKCIPVGHQEIDKEPMPDDIAYVHDDGRMILAKELSCYTCQDNQECEYAWDAYNTNGDCLALK